MEDNNTIRFGENIANDVKSAVNDEIKDILRIAIKSFSEK